MIQFFVNFGFLFCPLLQERRDEGSIGMGIWQSVLTENLQA